MSKLETWPCLCLVTDRGFRPRGEFYATVAAAVENGATMVQLREKRGGPDALGDREVYEMGLELRRITRERGAILVVNDRLDLAMAIDADGVHLGQGDLPLAAAKRIWGPGRLYGLSASSLGQAAVALADGPDYLGVGAVYPTGTKLDATLSGLAVLAEVCASVDLPVLAIGGIGPANAAPVMAAGARGLAVVSAVWGAADPGAACAELARAAGTRR